MTHPAAASSHSPDQIQPRSSHPDGTRRRRKRLFVDGLALLASLVLCFAAAGIGSSLTLASLSTWYPGLAKPTWNPPNWVFGPVWTLLYTMMAISAWLVWRERGRQAVFYPLMLFAAQLLLNVLWSGLFFGWQSPGLALIDIVLLWGAILGTLIAFVRVQPAAGWLMIPYLLWVSFAGALNFAIWNLNR